MNTRLQTAIDSGVVKAVGGTGDLDTVISRLRECDEATVILRKGGKPVGVLVYSAAGSESDDGAIERGLDAIDAIRAA